MYRKLASALLVASAINAKYALALGLGGMTMHSALNQPLDAEIALSNVDGLDSTQIMITLATPEEFQKAGVDRTFFLSDIKFDVKLDGKGGGVVRLKSSKRLNEPYLDFLIEARWPAGRMLRSYTALVDLPVYANDTPAQVSAAASAPVEAPVSEKSAVVPAGPEPVASRPAVAAAKPAQPQKPNKTIAAPQERVAAQPAYSGGEYKVQPNESLSQIARRLRPEDDLSVNQTMLAIQKLNPNAFIRNNINLIKAGVVLRVPTAADIRQVSASAANQEVASQTREWRGPQLDATDVAKASAPKPVSVEEGRLSLTSAGSGLANGRGKAGDSGAGGQGTAAAGDSQETAKIKQQLDVKKDSLKRMIEVKDAELAALQSKLGKEPDAKGAAAPVSAASGKDNSAAAQPAAASAQDAKGEKSGAVNLQGAAGATPADAVKNAADNVANFNKSVAAQKKALDDLDGGAADTESSDVQEVRSDFAVAQAPVPVKEPGILDLLMANALYIGIGALVLMLGVVGVIFRRKSQSDRQAMAENDISNFDFEDESVVSAADVNLEDENSIANFDHLPMQEGFGSTESEPDEAEQETVSQTSDPVGEADIYIAYGRYDQAADLLQRSIQDAPSNIDLRTKLLEVYLEARNKSGFQQQFIELRNMGQTAALSQAKELLTTVDEAADWLDDLPADDMASASAEEDDFSSLLSDADLVEDDIDLGLDHSGNVDDFSFDEFDSALKPDPDEEDIALDLPDMDLSDDFGFTGELAEESHEDVIDLKAEASLDLPDTELGTVDNGDFSSELDLSLPADETVLDADAELDLGDMSFDLPEDFAPESSVEDILPEMTSESGVDESLAMDDFDFGLNDEAPAVADTSVADTTEEEELSLDGFELDFAEPEAVSDTGPVDIAVADELDFSDVDLGFDSGTASAEPTLLRDAVDLSIADESVSEPVVDEAEFDLGDLAEPEVFDAPAEAVMELPQDELSPELTETIEQPVATAVPVEEQHVSAPIATLESEDLEFLTDGDEVSTKLDLAQAYVDLGDIDGARDILLEVMKEGRDEQKAEAAALLDQLD